MVSVVHRCGLSFQAGHKAEDSAKRVRTCEPQASKKGRGRFAASRLRYVPRALWVRFASDARDGSCLSWPTTLTTSHTPSITPSRPAPTHTLIARATIAKRKRLGSLSSFESSARLVAAKGYIPHGPGLLSHTPGQQRRLLGKLGEK